MVGGGEITDRDELRKRIDELIKYAHKYDPKEKPDKTTLSLMISEYLRENPDVNGDDIINIIDVFANTVLTELERILHNDNESLLEERAKHSLEERVYLLEIGFWESSFIPEKKKRARAAHVALNRSYIEKQNSKNN